jgi:hypothetical protein
MVPLFVTPPLCLAGVSRMMVLLAEIAWLLREAVAPTPHDD